MEKAERDGCDCEGTRGVIGTTYGCDVTWQVPRFLFGSRSSLCGFLLWELQQIQAVGLVIHTGKREKKRAARGVVRRYTMVSVDSLTIKHLGDDGRMRHFILEETRKMPVPR